MVLSGEEQERWREVEAELARDRRLVGLARRLASVGVGLPVKTCVLWLVGGITGLILVIAGDAQGHRELVAAGLDVLIGTVLVAGVLLIVIGVAHGQRH
jgi:hypothetical protein